ARPRGFRLRSSRLRSRARLWGGASGRSASRRHPARVAQSHPRSTTTKTTQPRRSDVGSWSAILQYATRGTLELGVLFEHLHVRPVARRIRTHERRFHRLRQTADDILPPERSATRRAMSMERAKRRAETRGVADVE